MTVIFIMIGFLSRSDATATRGQSTAASASSRRKPAYVGKYCVDVESFESVALPALANTASSSSATAGSASTCKWKHNS